MLRFYELRKSPFDKMERLIVSVYRFQGDSPLEFTYCPGTGKIEFVRKYSHDVSFVTDEMFRLLQFIDNPRWVKEVLQMNARKLENERIALESEDLLPF